MANVALVAANHVDDVSKTTTIKRDVLCMIGYKNEEFSPIYQIASLIEPGKFVKVTQVVPDGMPERAYFTWKEQVGKIELDRGAVFARDSSLAGTPWNSVVIFWKFMSMGGSGTGSEFETGGISQGTRGEHVIQLKPRGMLWDAFLD